MKGSISVQIRDIVDYNVTYATAIWNNFPRIRLRIKILLKFRLLTESLIILRKTFVALKQQYKQVVGCFLMKSIFACDKSRIHLFVSTNLLKFGMKSYFLLLYFVESWSQYITIYLDLLPHINRTSPDVRAVPTIMT